MDLIVILIFIIAIWLFSIYLLSDWKYIYWYTFLNLFLIVIYFSVIILGDNYFWRKDLFGLAMFFRLILTLILHTVIGFIFALYKGFKIYKK